MMASAPLWMAAHSTSHIWSRELTSEYFLQNACTKNDIQLSTERLAGIQGFSKELSPSACMN
jgi:hypothetical protein